MDTQYLMSLKHILLPAQVGKAEEKLATSIKKMVREWMGGGTSCGDAVRYNFLMPNVREALLKIQMKQWKKAFDILLGLQLFASGGDDWIRDQEVYTEFEEFSGRFSDCSSAWLQVLDSRDNQLDLVVVGGGKEWTAFQLSDEHLDCRTCGCFHQQRLVGPPPLGYL